MPKNNRHRLPPRKVQPTGTKVKPAPWPRPVIGVLLERSISHADKVFWPLLAIAQQGFPFITINHGRTDLVRNKMALHLLRSTFTHLIMLDIDHIHPVDIVQQLMKPFIDDKERKLRVVGGLNFRRGEPYDPCAFLKGDDGKFYPISEWPRGLVKVDALGTGCIAIAREVFEQLDPPWFFNEYHRVMEDYWPGEDMGFAKICREAGIDQHVLTTLTSPHLIDAVVDEGAFRAYIADAGYLSAPVAHIQGKEVSKEDVGDLPPTASGDGSGGGGG